MYCVITFNCIIIDLQFFGTFYFCCKKKVKHVTFQQKRLKKCQALVVSKLFSHPSNY